MRNGNGNKLLFIKHLPRTTLSDCTAMYQLVGPAHTVPGSADDFTWHFNEFFVVGRDSRQKHAKKEIPYPFQTLFHEIVVWKHW